MDTSATMHMHLFTNLGRLVERLEAAAPAELRRRWRKIDSGDAVRKNIVGGGVSQVGMLVRAHKVEGARQTA